jgi:hypothetical protein
VKAQLSAFSVGDGKGFATGASPCGGRGFVVESDRDRFVITAAHCLRIVGGMSGSPILTDDGLLVGIMCLSGGAGELHTKGGPNPHGQGRTRCRTRSIFDGSACPLQIAPGAIGLGAQMTFAIFPVIQVLRRFGKPLGRQNTAAL